MATFPLPSSPHAIVFNLLRVKPATASELQQALDNSTVWQHRQNPVQQTIKQLISVNGYDITEKKTKGETTYTMK